jgi:hypothetical protein
MDGPPKGDDKDALYRALLLKIPTVADATHLKECVELGLAMLLQRDTDKLLRDELHHDLAQALADIPAGQGPERIHGELRIAAKRCVHILEAAKERRKPRAVVHPRDNWAVAGKVHHGSVPRRRRRRWPLVVAAVVGMAVMVVVAWKAMQQAGEEDLTPGAQLAEQMAQAAQGVGPATHLFGGALRVEIFDGRPVVVAEEVPPRMCVAAGWDLKGEGVLTINGITAPRLSAAKISELCNLGKTATIQWMPRPDEPENERK